MDNTATKLYKKAVKAYYDSGQPIMTDPEFDALEAQIAKTNPKLEALSKTGHGKIMGTKLLEFMPSLAKYYADSIPKIKKKWPNRTLAMHKLDGASLQLVYKSGKPYSLTTRGDGTEGGSITFLLPYMNVPAKIKSAEKLVFRCEAVIKRSVFVKKYSQDFDTPRNAVNGWLNRKEGSTCLADVDIVVLGVYGYPMKEGLELAAKLGFNTVRNWILQNYQLDELPVMLSRIKASAEYDIDGLVLTSPDAMMAYTSADKPKWIAAFKENVDLREAPVATVEEIVWQHSANNRLIPKLRITPITIDGVKITFVTAHNAQWVVKRKIGKGTTIKVVRSGDVIPKIAAVVKPTRTDLPNVRYKEEGVHFVATKSTDESKVRSLLKFCRTLGIEGVAGKTLEMLRAGGIKSGLDLFDLDARAMAKLGVGEAVSKRLAAQLKTLCNTPIPIHKLMVASQCFGAGLGERKIKAIIKHDPKILAKLLAGKHASLLDVPGFSLKTAQLVQSHMPAFIEWYKRAQEYFQIELRVKAGNLKVAFTGYRSVIEEKALTQLGCEVVAFSKKVDVLLYSPAAGKTSGKLQTAREAGIRVTDYKTLLSELKK